MRRIDGWLSELFVTVWERRRKAKPADRWTMTPELAALILSAGNDRLAGR